MMTPNDEIVVRLEKPVAGGAMLGHHEGRVILVTGAIAGELARVRIDKVARGYAQAVMVEAIEPDPDRRTPAVDAACGGNAYTHITYPRQLALKREVIRDAFARIGRLTLPEAFPVAPSHERGYRMRARLSFRHGRVGFVREGTHELCDPATTGQLRPDTEQALVRLSPWLGDVAWRRARAIELAEDVTARERVIHIESPDARRERPGDRSTLTEAGFTGATVGLSRFSTLWGSPTVSDPLDRYVRSVSVDPVLRLRRHAGSFFQANRFLVGDLVEAVLREAIGEPLVDLYAGVGLHAVVHAAVGRGPITAVEGDSRTWRDLQANVAPLGDAISVRRLSVEDYLARAVPGEAGVTIVNPPRTGLSRVALDGLIRLAPRRVVYVSCDVATVARDVRRLVDASYELRHLEAFDLFPNTAHVETLVVLEGPPDRRAAASPSVSHRSLDQPSE